MSTQLPPTDRVSAGAPLPALAGVPAADPDAPLGLNHVDRETRPRERGAATGRLRPPGAGRLAAMVAAVREARPGRHPRRRLGHTG